jgi:hypothetical protein
MIYPNIPLKYQYIPGDINNEYFRIIFCVYLVSWLESVKEEWLESMDEEDVLDGERLKLAQGAKELHNFLEEYESFILITREKIWGLEKMQYVKSNVNIDNIQFDYTDCSNYNVNCALDIFVAIAKYHGRDKDVYRVMRV